MNTYENSNIINNSKSILLAFNNKLKNTSFYKNINLSYILKQRRRFPILLSSLSFINISLILSVSLITSPAYSEIIADANAPRKLQPKVIKNTGNGLPVKVNIRPPNAEGISHNQYSTFDVDNRGVLLINSKIDMRSQLGFDVKGNPKLHAREANVILNEVNSALPSQLNGYIESVGRNADIIIANPSGIVCNGCAFINSSKTTLAAAKPLIRNKKLDGYSVSDGKISFIGNNFYDRSNDYTNLIARSIEVNSRIYADNLIITTGHNNISSNSNMIVKKLDDGKAPSLALDVSALGGMYANRIRMIGTENGVGVNNAGEIRTEVDKLLLHVNGTLNNKGLLSAETVLDLNSNNGVYNSGTFKAKKNILINQTKSINSPILRTRLLRKIGSINPNIETKTRTLQLDIEKFKNAENSPTLPHIQKASSLSKTGKTTVDEISLTGDVWQKEINDSNDYFKSLAIKDLKDNVASFIIENAVNIYNEDKDTIAPTIGNLFDTTIYAIECSVTGNNCSQIEYSVIKNITDNNTVNSLINSNLIDITAPIVDKLIQNKQQSVEDLADTAISKLFPTMPPMIDGFNPSDSQIIHETKDILNSDEMLKIKQAYQDNQSIVVNVKGRMIQYEPALPASGMTMFGENGFLIGREAFKSQTELNKTILHLLHLLNTSSLKTGISGETASKATRSAFNFSEKASHILINQ